MKNPLIVAGVVIVILGAIILFTTMTRTNEPTDAIGELPPYPDASELPTPPEPPAPYSGPSNENLSFTETNSGLQYAVINEGQSDRQPLVSNTVSVHYHGTLEDGSVFDSSYQRGEPIQFPLQGLIPGWQEGIPLMTVGSTYRFIIPAELAYGPEGSGHPLGGQTLTFDVELLEIL